MKPTTTILTQERIDRDRERELKTHNDNNNSKE